ncbi:M20/M25/M40 family metallo-hydrolase [Blastococcus sp. PRF04-17]|uniref:M20/M25/M40 family metallo-hydrolase n=1 Tax=Blastococcus sp. PRF04-17 TaxID=2933797 RepID=UPI001FF1670A|nr:M20/M25/M40 family metallo-hydrolase [Blastococcus sp. PRF04-17]UOY02869.1 M20/M25/M40 family metallo-hydrolase [Blastococcus sp. PRF04-17]
MRAAGLVVVALLLGLIGWSVASLQPPDPVSADGPPTEFSAERAFGHVERIATRTHATGSAANDDVVDGLVSTLTDLGLDTRVQNSVGARASGVGEAHMARVRNVVAVLPGTGSTGRLFLTAHHDSVATGPGAADDAAGVAAVLETVRALRAGEPLRNDVVVVLTDAEGACRCGAEAFAGVHPLAAGGGVMLNFEARGSSGPPIMFRTSPGNAGLIDAYAAAAMHPVASSVAVEVHRVLPNSTDFTVLTGRDGFTGLDTAFVDGSAGYHTPQDQPARVDRGSLQALGDNALALTREFGTRDLGPLVQEGADDATYFPVLGELVRYPDRFVVPIALAGLGAVVLVAVVAARRGRSPYGRTAAGAALALVPLVLAPLAVTGLWWVMGAVRPAYREMLDPWRPGWFRVTVLALVAAVVLTWYVALRRRIGAVPLIVGALAWPATLGVVLALVAPGGSYLGAWPALAGEWPVCSSSPAGGRPGCWELS